MLFPKCLHQSWSGLRQSRMRWSQPFCISDFPHCALHMVPLASQASINPFLSQETTSGAVGFGSLPRRGAVSSQPAPALPQPPSPQRLLDSPLVDFISNLSQVYTTETPLNPGFDVSIGKLWWPALLRMGSAKGIFHLVSSKLQQCLGTPVQDSVHPSQWELPYE